MEGFNVSIAECSKELTARERVLMKDTGNAVKFDEVVKDDPLVITPASYAVLNVHNEKADNKDYYNYIIIDKDGTKYVTGSSSFWNAFKQIWDEMESEDEPYQVEVYKVDSKNYKGKKFLSCSII